MTISGVGMVVTVSLLRISLMARPSAIAGPDRAHCLAGRDVGGLLQAGLGYLVEPNIPHVMENHGFHVLLLVPPASSAGAVASAAGVRPLVFRLAGGRGVPVF
ncbi:hypothetical protein FQZ97_909180 [compost metagenome]